MRQFLLGIVATVVGGFLLFWITNWYSGWAETAQYEVEYQTSVAAGFLDNVALDAIVSAVDAGDSASRKIAIIRIENNSDQDIRNAKFIISPTERTLTEDNLHGFGLASYIRGSFPSPSLTLSGDGIEVLFPILESENGVYLWVLHEPTQGFRVYSETKDVTLKEWAERGQEDSSGMDFLFIAAVVVVFLISGIAIGDAVNRDIVKKAGYDPQKIKADYYRALAKDSEVKATEALGDE